MTTLRLNGRAIGDYGISFEVHAVDSFIEWAYYEDDGSDLTEEELDLLTNEYQDIVYESHLMSNVERVDFMGD